MLALDLDSVRVPTNATRIYRAVTRKVTSRVRTFPPSCNLAGAANLRQTGIREAYHYESVATDWRQRLIPASSFRT